MEEFRADFRRRIHEVTKELGKASPATLLDEISQLQEDLRQKRESLPNRDLERYDKQLADLATKARAAPKKFAFKSKLSLGGANVPTSTQAPGVFEPQSTAAGTSVPSAPTPRGKVLPPQDGLDSCVIFSAEPLATLHLKNLRNCIVILKKVDGPLHVDSVDGCTFILTCHQLRIHDSSQSSFFLGCARPIIENSRSLSFGGLQGSTALESVSDFDWVREGQSANWQRLSVEAFVDWEAAIAKTEPAAARLLTQPAHEVVKYILQ